MIVGVAFQNKSTNMLISLPRPNRHSDVIRLLWEETNKQAFSKGGWVQGFIDSNGLFLTRQEAAAHVLRVGQELTDYAKAEYEKRPLEILFSEDVW